MHTFSEEGFRYFVKGATGAKKWKELDIEAQKRVTENARNLTATRALALAKIRLGDFAGAAPWIKKLTEDPVAGTEERIFAAWTRIASGKVDQEALTKFKGTNEGSRAPAKFQYTLAMMHALLDAPDDAQQALLLGIDQEDYIHLSAAAWVVYGKICEQYGFPTEAVAAFARAKDPAQDDDELAEWSLPLAKPGAQTIPGVP